MITKPKRRRGVDNYPDVTLRCDGPECKEEHTFAYGTPYHQITHWAKAHGWRITYKGAGLFKHHCPICERFTVASAGYFKRIEAYG